jgi:hypothetical protein
VDLLFPELSFKIVEACFDAFNEVGGNKSERTYQKAVKVCLNHKKICFREQVYCPIGLLIRFASDGVTFCRVLRPNAA